MSTNYAYSLTGESNDYHGSYTNRRDARAAALEALKQMHLPNPPTTVFVGRMVPADPQVKGHAREVIREMTRRGDVFGLSNYLVGLTVEQVSDLDRELAGTVSSWLTKHHLEPKAFKIEAVSEYPVPTVRQVESGPLDEVHDLGQSRDV